MPGRKFWIRAALTLFAVGGLLLLAAYGTYCGRGGWNFGPQTIRFQVRDENGTQIPEVEISCEDSYGRPLPLVLDHRAYPRHSPVITPHVNWIQLVEFSGGWSGCGTWGLFAPRVHSDLHFRLSAPGYREWRVRFLDVVPDETRDHHDERYRDPEGWIPPTVEIAVVMEKR